MSFIAAHPFSSIAVILLASWAAPKVFQFVNQFRHFH